MKWPLAMLVCAALAQAETGVLIPGDHEQPDPEIFSLNEMSVDILVDNGTARVEIRQIFANHSGLVQEGTYQFALPSGATVSDFAVWDDVTRIPGVILERRRAGEIYEQAKAQAIDPGLLQMGERDADEARRSQLFSARIVPIPAFGTKRIEIEYQYPVAVENYQSELVVPLKPDVYGLQTAGHLAVTFELRSEHAIKDFNAIAKTYPFQIRERTPNLVKAVFFGPGVELKEDLAVRYTLDDAQADTLRVITQREDPAAPGFFQAGALIRAGAAQRQAPQPPRTVVVLFDNSLSMQWEKLEGGFTACETALAPVAAFRLVQPDSVQLRTGAILAATRTGHARPHRASPGVYQEESDSRRHQSPARIDRRAGAVRHWRALPAPDRRRRSHRKHRPQRQARRMVSKRVAQAPAARRRHTLVFAVGDDANQPLLKMLAANNGFFEWVRSTEPLDFKLNAFLDKIGQDPVKGLSLSLTPAANFEMVYPLEDVRFAGSVASWAGRYKQPAAGRGLRRERNARPPAVGDVDIAADARSKRRSSLPAANLGQSARRCPARKDRAGWRRPRNYR